MRAVGAYRAQKRNAVIVENTSFVRKEGVYLYVGVFAEGFYRNDLVCLYVIPKRIGMLGTRRTVARITHHSADESAIASVLCVGIKINSENLVAFGDVFKKLEI